MPILDLMEALLKRTVKLTGFEDNEATEKIIENGYSPALRHMGRVHGVSIARLNESFYGDNAFAEMKRCETGSLKADIFTKSYDTVAKWFHALKLIGDAGR